MKGLTVFYRRWCRCGDDIWASIHTKGGHNNYTCMFPELNILSEKNNEQKVLVPAGQVGMWFIGEVLKLGM